CNPWIPSPYQVLKRHQVATARHSPDNYRQFSAEYFALLPALNDLANSILLCDQILSKNGFVWLFGNRPASTTG
ncbi:hypothetical protein AAULR_06924, partial [Lacticaseibacillus rhamnosus MTCC 5462]